MIELSREDSQIHGSERSFGLVFAMVFALIALWPLTKGGPLRWWAVAAASAFLVVGYVWPAVLRPLNVAWFRLGLLLSAVVTPVVMGLLYVTTFVPIGLVLRMAGRDVLGLKREPDRATYWIPRNGADSGQGTLRRQF